MVHGTIIKIMVRFHNYGVVWQRWTVLVSERMRRVHREFSLSQSHKTFHDAVTFVLEAQPPMGEEHELQHRRELD